VHLPPLNRRHRAKFHVGSSISSKVIPKKHRYHFYQKQCHKQFYERAKNCFIPYSYFTVPDKIQPPPGVHVRTCPLVKLQQLLVNLVTVPHILSNTCSTS
jgi:hypothetical protein